MDTKKLDLNLLVTLEALLAERNVTKAAERLGLSQPAVSAQLARLRDIFGDQLLVPAQRGMTPTARALAVEKILGDALDSARGVITYGVEFDPAREALDVAIVAADVVQYTVLLPFAVELRSRAPGVHLSLRGYDLPTLARQAETGEIDLAITRPEVAPETLLSRKLLARRFMLIARHDHPVVHSRISLDEFLALEHVSVQAGRARLLDPAELELQALGKSRKVVLTVSNFLVAADVVAKTDLIAIVPQDVATDRSDRLQFIEPPLDIPAFTLVLVWHPRNQSHAGHRWVRDALVANAGRYVMPHQG